MPGEEMLYDLADLFKTIGDSTRIRIISALLKEQLCVCDIAAVLGMSVSAVSHQLRILKQAKLVRSRREGKTVYYSLDDEHVGILFDTGLVHIGEMRRYGDCTSICGTSYT
ncbi:MAG: metalloregulator ArsR/SmtB family transcription factor [Spirochaetaceae bacterium]|nr:metalloregulator ArsR/SmtB family transcription factor [Spirochaetaceae bacterium]